MIETPKVPKVSVTVPIYNAGRYLHKCLESLANQTLKEIEVILVDDGSTDGSGEVCDEYAAKYSNFRVIHKSNGGSASARQAGLDAAKGEYVIVCDSDDWPEPDMYRKLYEAAKDADADIAMCGFFSEYSDGRSVPTQTLFNENEGLVNLQDFRLRGARSSWLQLIKRDLFKSANAEYVQGINLGEDSLIILKLTRANPRMVQIREPLYHYRRLLGEDTLTHNLKMSSIHQLYYVYDWAKDNYPDEPELHRRRAADIAVACMRVKDLDVKWFKAFVKNDLKWSAMVQKPFFIKSGIAMIIKVLPFSISKKFFNILYPIVYK